jgi:hypothetical protein
VLEQASCLTVRAKVVLIRKLMAQLETDQIQTVLECGLREIGERQQRGTTSVGETHNTRLLLKKDYSYQDRGLSQPTQYYVYLRRRKPKLDRYIGTLFYIPQGCALSYFLDAEGRIVFNPPYNVFQLCDCNNPAIVQIVRLVCLQPPPPEYTFTKQQQDTPQIYLHLEYLDPNTYQPIAQKAYPFPVCMYEGGQLDRYRWEVSALAPPPAIPELRQLVAQNLVTQDQAVTSVTLNSTEPVAESVTKPVAESVPDKSLRRVFELSNSKSLTFYLINQADLESVLKRMRLWVAWSEKAMPQSRWEVIREGTTYTLMNSRFKRKILTLCHDRAAITLENSLPALIKWFHDLSLAVSQAQSQKQYSAAQLKLAHSLFVEMSLPQTDPLVVLKKLFGVEFVKHLPGG